ncbi:MAG: MotA/TolQ/ExbB proton channel family protein [Leptospiraceae bacterium]|nr:MotA/TolQ/ExbB proton channel family protein [Leptospiraceae bacterium]MCK6379969.1 MotA/TolQ/ExbB proton channel family protein [Leptospiraceae bacterium]NUM40070.1 MotA/TolQ/ExbB proton channel family protein [Leptospiraceae bacterium]
MNLTTIFGISVAVISVLAALIFEGVSVSGFIKLSSLLLILGGTLGATFASFTFSQIQTMFVCLKRAIYFKQNDDLSELFQGFAEKARRNGLLSLEEDISGIQNSLFQKGIRLIVDGSDPSIVEEILFESAEQETEKEIFSAKILDTAGGFSPTMGIIGTVVGLVHVLENLGAGTSALGKGIATAFIATFYGIGFANLLFLPLANKVRSFSKQENGKRHAIVRGILSLQSGDNRRILAERMAPFID